jgi:hypothetical protein
MLKTSTTPIKLYILLLAFQLGIFWLSAQVYCC